MEIRVNEINICVFMGPKVYLKLKFGINKIVRL
jgi:hypothetical protein